MRANRDRIPRPGLAAWLLPAVVLALVPRAASAQDVPLPMELDPPVHRVATELALDDYLGGIVRLNSVYVGLGGLGIGAGVALLDQDREPGGMALPLLIVGAVHIAAAVATLIAARVRRVRLGRHLRAAPWSFVEDDMRRMDREARLFHVYHAVEALGVAAGGAVSGAGYGLDRPRLAGIGLGVLIGSAITLLLDLATARNASRYRRALWTLQVTDGTEPQLPIGL